MELITNKELIELVKENELNTKRKIASDNETPIHILEKLLIEIDDDIVKQNVKNNITYQLSKEEIIFIKDE